VLLHGFPLGMSICPSLISMSTGTSRVAVADGSPVPVLRAKQGCTAGYLHTEPDGCAVALTAP